MPIEPSHVDGTEGAPLAGLDVSSPPAAPYTLIGCIDVTRDSFPAPILGVRASSDEEASDWYQTEYELIAQTELIDRYEVRSHITAGSATQLLVDPITFRKRKFVLDKPNPEGDLLPTQPASVINADAENLIHTENAVVLAFQTRGGTYRVSLTGGFDTENKMWTSGARSNGGYHRYGKIIQTLYKHVPVLRGGGMGYLHIGATIMADTPEIQFEVNWHNGAIEERQEGYLDPVKSLGGESNIGTPHSAYGQFRGEDIIFNRVAMEISPTIPLATGFAGDWKWTPRLPDPVHDTAHNAFVKVIAASDSNRLHVVPITFERPFRFAVHPDSVTPYLKLVMGMHVSGGANIQSTMLLKANLQTPIGDAHTLSFDLAAEATTCKDALTALTPWQIEGDSASGSLPVSSLWPMSYVSYGGMTAGTGMLPWYGIKWALTAQKAAYEILLVEQLRVRARTHGALYYNISGMPVNPLAHAAGGLVAPWARFNRTFEKRGGIVKDLPFKVTASLRKMDLADYNPGPGGFAESSNDRTPSTPDWWVLPVAGNAITPLPYLFKLVTTTLPDPINDPAEQVIIQLQGAGAYDENKSVTFRVTGTDNAGAALVEDVVFLGSAASTIPVVQAIRSVGFFKTVTKVEATAKTGSLLSTELFSVGRAAVAVANYNGGDNITPMDDQHFIRMHHINRTLFLGCNDLMAKIYCAMDAASFRMTQWEGDGIAKRLFSVDGRGVGRGTAVSREMAWGCDMIATAYAMGCAHFGQQAAEVLYGRWITTFVSLIGNSKMSNGLFQSYSAKEGKQTPFGTANGGEGNGVFWMCSGREAAYFTHALAMLSNLYNRPGQNATLRSILGGFGPAFRDLLWHTLASGTSTLTHIYMPVALHRSANGTIRRPDVDPIDLNGTWEIFATKDDLPALNPWSGCVLHPDQYPPIDDDLYVASTAGNNAKFGSGSPSGSMTAFTTGAGLLREDTNSGGAGLLPTPVEIKVTARTLFISGATWTEATKTLLKVGGFASYTFAAGDIITITSGTGATPGEYVVASKTSNDAIVLVTSIGAGADAQTDISGDFTFGNGKRRTIRVVGTSPLGAALTDDILVVGKAAATQTYRSLRHFKTVTSAKMLTVAELAATAGSTPNLGTLDSSMLFKFGTPAVGLQFNDSNSDSPTFGENFQLGYALDNIINASEVEAHGAAAFTCVQRFCGSGDVPAADEAAVRAKLYSWTEYQQQPGRYEQWAGLAGTYQFLV